MIDTCSGPYIANKEYCFRLANNQGWHIITTEGVREWGAKLAAILELKTYNENSYPKLIFVKRSSRIKNFEKLPSTLAPAIRRQLPAKGWNVQDHGLIRFWFHKKTEDVICELAGPKLWDIDILKMYQALHPIHTQALSSGGLPLHAALVERNGIGAVLAAPGNTGKTTCCRRLPPPWQAMSDDETLIVRNDEKKYFAHPFPTLANYFRGDYCHTRNVQEHISLKAIFFLEQAEDDEVIPVKQGQATILAIHSAMQICYRNWNKLGEMQKQELKKKLFENASELAITIPAFILRASLSGKFWNEMEKVLL